MSKLNPPCRTDQTCKSETLSKKKIEKIVFMPYDESNHCCIVGGENRECQQCFTLSANRKLSSSSLSTQYYVSQYDFNTGSGQRKVMDVAIMLYGCSFSLYNFFFFLFIGLVADQLKKVGKKW